MGDQIFRWRKCHNWKELAGHHDVHQASSKSRILSFSLDQQTLKRQLLHHHMPQICGFLHAHNDCHATPIPTKYTQGPIWASCNNSSFEMAQTCGTTQISRCILGSKGGMHQEQEQWNADSSNIGFQCTLLGSWGNGTLHTKTEKSQSGWRVGHRLILHHENGNSSIRTRQSTAVHQTDSTAKQQNTTSTTHDSHTMASQISMITQLTKQVSILQLAHNQINSKLDKLAKFIMT